MMVRQLLMLLVGFWLAMGTLAVVGFATGFLSR